MKRVVVNTGMVALVYRNNEYKRCLTAGKYWLMPWETALHYDMGSEFRPGTDLNILIQDERLADLMHVVHVRDSEMVVVYRDDIFSQILSAGKYAYWRGLIEYQFDRYDMSEMMVPPSLDRQVLKRSAFAPYVRVCKVESHEKAILYVNKVPEETLSPGEYYFWKNATDIEVSKVDLRQRHIESIGQEILTKDKATVRINFYMTYRVVDIDKALIENKDYEKQLYINMQMVLRQYLGTYTLDELLQRKSDIGGYVAETLSTELSKLGIAMSKCGIKDIILPGEVRDIMSKVLVAEKSAQANLIMRREETASTRSLLNTAKLMEDNKMLYKLKEMEYVERIADKISTISLGSNGKIVDQLATIFSPAQ